MRTLGKIIGWLIGIIILLYIILALVLHYAIKPETYKSWVETAVYKATGHQMVIDGTLEWSTFPNPTVRITNVIIKNQQGSTHVSPYFAKIGEADLRISLMHLFSGKIIPKMVILRDAHLNLVYESAGKNPLAQLQHKAQSAQQHSNTATKAQSTPQTSAKPSLKLKDDRESHLTYLQHMQLPDVMLTNSSINWINLKNNQITNFKDINLRINPTATSAFIKGNITIVHQQHTVTLALSTTLQHTADNTLLTLQRLSFNGTDSSKGVTNTLDYQGDITANLVKQTVDLPTYQLTWNQLPMHGKIHGSWTNTNNTMAATFTASTQLADGMINEKGTFTAPDHGSNHIKYLISIHHINLVPVLKSLHYDNLLKGTANMTAHITADNSGNGWIANLNGGGNFRLTDAELGKLNSAHYINQAMQILHRKQVQNDGVTVFSSITGSFTLHNGVFYNDDLKLSARKLTSTGTGTINFNTNMINYKLYLAHNDSDDIKLPLDITGPLKHPEVKPDLADLGKAILKKSIKKKVFDNIFHDKHIDFKKIL